MLMMALKIYGVYWLAAFSSYGLSCSLRNACWKSYLEALEKAGKDTNEWTQIKFTKPRFIWLNTIDNFKEAWFYFKEGIRCF